MNNRFVLYPEIVFMDRRLSPTDKLCWTMYASHCIGKDQCWPSQERIAAMMNIDVRHVRRITRRLVEQGHLILHSSPGKVNRYEIPLTHRAGVNDGLNTDLSDTPALQSLPPLTQGAYHPCSPEPTELYKENKIKEEKKKSTPPPSPPKKWKTIPRTIEARNEAIEKTDIEKYRAKWGSRINFEAELEKWKEYAREGKARRPWKDYDDALDKWCGRAFEWGSKPVPPPPKPINAGYKYVEESPNDSEYLKYLASLKEKRDAKVAARQTEKPFVPEIERKTSPSVTKVMSKEEIIAEMKRIANG